MFRLLTLMLLLVLLVACAKDPTRRTALIVADEIDVFEQQVGNKIAKERKFYNANIAEAKTAAKWNVIIQSNIEQLQGIQALTDAMLKQDGDVEVIKLQDFLRTHNARMRNAEAEHAKAIAEQEEAFSVSFAKLSINRKDLRDARSEVMELARKETVKDRAQAIAKVTFEARKKLHEEKKAEIEANASSGE